MGDCHITSVLYWHSRTDTNRLRAARVSWKRQTWESLPPLSSPAPCSIKGALRGKRLFGLFHLDFTRTSADTACPARSDEVTLGQGSVAGAGYGDGNGPGTKLGLLCQTPVSLSPRRASDSGCTGRAYSNQAESSLGIRTRLAGGSGHSLRGIIAVKEPLRPKTEKLLALSFPHKALQPASPLAVALQSGSASFLNTFKKIFFLPES